MSNSRSPNAGKLVNQDRLLDVPRLVSAYFTGRPDPGIASQRVAFGTSGHRGSAFDLSFNEPHILAITQAICQHRKAHSVTGPLFVGIDTHALSIPALGSAIEVLAANGVDVMLDAHGGYTPVPVISYAILGYNKDRKSGLADGIVITPSHNPPEYGGFKYNTPNGGPAAADVTSWIEHAANAFLEHKLADIERMPYERAVRSPHIGRHDYMTPYIADLGNVVDMGAIRAAGVTIGIDPLGGAAVHYWAPIIERYGIDATVVNTAVDPTFRFVTADWDGNIRTDCSSAYAVAPLIGLAARFDVAFANDADADRHGIVTRSTGLMPPNHYLAVAIAYLFRNRSDWSSGCGIGKTIVSSSLVDRVARKVGRKLVEVPVGFKWFVDGLFDGSLGFAGEESGGASFLRRDGSVWTTDKDGLILGLLAAEITARTEMHLGELYDDLTRQLGLPFYERTDAPATPEEKRLLKVLSSDQAGVTKLAGEPVRKTFTDAPGDGMPIGGLKVVAENGWFAVRPSGTENVYKIYAESFRSEDHLHEIQQQAKAVVEGVVGQHPQSEQLRR